MQTKFPSGQSQSLNFKIQIRYTKRHTTICSSYTHLAPVKTFLALSDVTFDVRFQLRAHIQQLLLSARRNRQDNINTLSRAKGYLIHPWSISWWITITKHLRSEKTGEGIKVIPFDELGRTENLKLHLPVSEGYNRGSRTETHETHSVRTWWIQDQNEILRLEHFKVHGVNHMLTCWSKMVMSSLSFWPLLEELSMPRRRVEGCMRGRYGLSSESWASQKTRGRERTTDYWRWSLHCDCQLNYLKKETEKETPWNKLPESLFL